MGRGWRRAFCTSVGGRGEDDRETTSDPEGEQLKSRLKLGGFFSSSSSSNPSTPRLPRQHVPTPHSESPKPAATAPPAISIHRSNKGSPRLSSSPASGTRSPSRFALLKTALRLSRNRCGICAGSVRTTGEQRTAVFTAECSHLFHFPCISAHVRTHSCLVCPVCSATWHEVPLLSSSLLNPNSSSSHHQQQQQQHVDVKNKGSHQSQRACKLYDDDESLQPSPASPSASSCGVHLQFNPIPEGDEEEEESDVHGNGGRVVGIRGGDANIRVMPEATALLSTDRNHQIYVVAIKVKAPSIPPRPAPAAMALPPSLLDPSRRAPVDLVTVLDASASMTAAKLQMLKRAMRLLVSSLGPADRLAIVAFSSVAAKRLLPLRRMSRPGQRAARQIVDRLVVCGGSQNRGSSCPASSCAGDALRKATKVLEDRRERNPVATIMLLSDGHGQQQQQQNHHHYHQQRNYSSSSVSPGTRFAHLEIPIDDSTSPSKQNVKQRILAQADGDDALTKCVNGLVSVVLQDVHLQFAFPSGVISSVYSYTATEGVGRGTVSHGEGGRYVRLGDMYAEEERELLVEIRVPKTAVVGSHSGVSSLPMSVVCSYRDPVSGQLIQCGERPLAIMPGISFPRHTSLQRSSSSSSSSAVAAASSSTSQDEQLMLRNMFVTTRAMVESRRLVDLNQLDTAVHLISSARSLILQQSNWSKVSSTTNKKFLVCLETELAQLQQQQRREQQQHSFAPTQRQSEQAVLLSETMTRSGGGGGEQPLTPTSAWRAAEQLAKVAIMRKSMNRVSDLHGLENARF